MFNANISNMTLSQIICIRVNIDSLRKCQTLTFYKIIKNIKCWYEKLFLNLQNIFDKESGTGAKSGTCKAHPVLAGKKLNIYVMNFRMN